MRTKKLIYTALFIALGILLPQTFHMIGGPGVGAVLLPMHIPVLVGAIILGPIYGFIIGTLSVLVGFLLGMPTLPMAVFMLFELGIYGLVAGYLGHTRRFNHYVSLVGAMITGRLVSLATMQIAIRFLGAKLPPIFGTVAIFSAGVPGIFIQLIVVPILVFTIRRYFDFERTFSTT